MKRHFWKWFTRLIFATWLMGLVVVLYWQLYPYEIATIQEPIKILNENKEVSIGEPIKQELKIHKPSNFVPMNVSRTMLCEDGNLVTLSPNIATNLPIGKYTLINDKYVLPPKVAVGSRCIFVWKQSYKVNPIRTVPVEWKSETFNVVKE